MEKFLQIIGHAMYGLRAVMSFFYIGLIAIIFYVLYKFGTEVLLVFSPDNKLSKMDLIIKVLELVDMTMVAQLVWVVALAGYSLFVTAGHFDSVNQKKPDWLDHVNTYNLKLKLAFAIISISGVHALKTYLKGGISSEEMLVVVAVHFMFVISAVGIAWAERLTGKRDDH